MPIETQLLDAMARTYISPMTSIRGRRVHRLIMRVFSRYDVVVQAVAEDGSPVLLGMSEDGGAAALTRTTGRGPAADVDEWVQVDGPRATSSFDLTKDSLPVLRRTTSPSSLAASAGALTVSSSDKTQPDQERVAAILRWAAGHDG